MDLRGVGFALHRRISIHHDVQLRVTPVPICVWLPLVIVPAAYQKVACTRGKSRIVSTGLSRKQLVSQARGHFAACCRPARRPCKKSTQALTVKYLTTPPARRQGLVNRISFSDRNSLCILPRFRPQATPMTGVRWGVWLARTGSNEGFIARHPAVFRRFTSAIPDSFAYSWDEIAVFLGNFARIDPFDTCQQSRISSLILPFRLTVGRFVPFSTRVEHSQGRRTMVYG
jgi:hypothetical protein